MAFDGPAISALIAASPPLDTNSPYCSLLLCTHFADTCVVAERGGLIVGWVSAYRVPDDLSRLFIWQVAVAESARGAGVGGAMLDALLARASVATVASICTTITPANDASWSLFSGFARRRDIPLTKALHFSGGTHFPGDHDDEWLVSIGPFRTAPSSPPA